MDILVKQSIYAKNGNVGDLKVKTQRDVPARISVSRSEGTLSLRIDLGSGGVRIDIDKLDELDWLDAVLGRVIKFHEK